MAFFNKKEEVLNIELTPVGRKKYSEGKFNPMFYSFSDEGVLYDASRASVTEEQNEVQKRIREVAKARKIPQIGIASVDKKVLRDEVNSTSENMLSSIDNEDEKNPSWEITTNESVNISSIENQLSSSSGRSFNIPQINIDSSSLFYETVPEHGIVPYREGCEDSIVQSDGNFVNFPDGSSVSVSGGSLFLRVEEKNIQYLKDNFEIEMFEVVKNSGEEKLSPLKFFKFSEQVKDGILQDMGYGANDAEQLEDIDNSFVSHYFELMVDGEVDDDIRCRMKQPQEVNNIFLLDDVDCVEEGYISVGDVYDEVDDSEMEDFFDEGCE